MRDLQFCASFLPTIDCKEPLPTLIMDVGMHGTSNPDLARAP